MTIKCGIQLLNHGSLLVQVLKNSVLMIPISLTFTNLY